MKKITLSDVINEQLKNKEFSEYYEKELLINAIVKELIQLKRLKNDVIGDSEMVENI